MNLCDTHCHIQSLGADSGEAGTRALWSKTDLTAAVLIRRAKEANVTRFICVGCDLEDSRLATDFADRFNAYASIGIHPHEAKRYVNRSKELTRFVALAGKERVVAIGECGLDYFYRHSEPEDQITLLRFQLDLAAKVKLPVIFHVREAFADFWPVYDSYPNIRAVLHSFTDTSATLDMALERGLYIGVNGIATFTRTPKMQEMFKSIPLERLLLETDAPFLTPTPYRGNINEPKQIVRIAEFLVELRHTTLDQLADTTTVNANRLFGL